MNFGNLLKIALKALGNNRMRTFLTMLGIIIGVGSVITMLAIGTGSKQSIRTEIGSMGTNVIMVMPGSGHFGGVRQSASSMQTLKMSDYRSLVNETTYIAHISPVVNSSEQAIYGSENTPTTIYGVSDEYLKIHDYTLESGTTISDEDIKKSAKVCLIGDRKSVV